MDTNISRRHFLKTKGAAVALPFMPSLAHAMADAPKKGDKPAKRFVFMYVPNGLVRRCFFPGEEEGELPGFVGGFNADKFKNEQMPNQTRWWTPPNHLDQLMQNPVTHRARLNPAPEDSHGLLALQQRGRIMSLVFGP